MKNKRSCHSRVQFCGTRPVLSMYSVPQRSVSSNEVHCNTSQICQRDEVSQN